MSEDQGSERDAPRPSSSRRSAVLFVKQRAGLLCPEGKPSKNKRSGFAIAPILYILGLVGVGAGVLFSGYSQILRSNITISNNVAAKNELSGAATTLAATAELSTDASLFCPPRSSHQSTGEPCVNAPEKLVQFADVDAGDASKLPTDYDAADDDGSPEEVGVFAAGSGLKQLDPWGHFYIYCRWENARADGSDPAILLISAGANNKLESNCASTVAQNDDQMIRLNVGEAIQRAALWQATGTADVRYGATGSQVLVTASGDVTALTMTASMLSITGTAAINALTATTATLTALNLSTPLPVTSGGTGANNAYDALTNFGVSVMGRYLFNSTVLDSATAEAVRQTLLNSGTIGDALFVETTASGGRATLGATVMGDYLFSSSVLDTATAASVRQILLNSGTVGDALFVETTASGARTTLGAGEIGDALFVEETATSARSTLGGGAIGSPLFTAANTASAWNILGLTGTLSPTLDIHISGNAANVTGTVAIANGGTGETSASAALDSLFSLDTAPSQTISDSRLSNTGVTPGSYNLVTVDAKGRVTSGSLVSNEQDHITNGVGSSIYTSATDGGYLIFSTASQVQMVLDPNGYLGIGTATPMERLHVNDGNVRISNESSEAGELQFTTDANSRRWIIATGSGTQDFFIDRYDDGGTQIGSALTILRSSGNATFSGSVAATGGFLGTLTGTLYGNVEGDITGSIGLEDGTEAAPALYFTDDTNVGIYRPGDDTMGLVTGGSNVLYLTATQSVGLGTTTPSQKLDVNGAINVSDAYYLSATKILHLPADDATSLAVGAGAGDGQTGATLYNTGLGADALFTNATGAGNVALGYQAGYLVNGGGNNVIIGRSVGSTTLTTGSGNVLIGTSASVTTPAAGTSNWLNIGNTLYGDLANRRIILTGATATAGTTPSEGTIIDLSAASGTAYSSLLLPRDTMDNRPTVGITGMIRYNTTTNTVEAYQGATAAWQTLLTSTGTAGASAYLGPSAVITNPSRGDDITTGLFSGTAGTVSISISGTERLRVTATGSVGIGTETPSQLLEVNGSINVTATSGAYNIANLKMLHMPGSDDTSIAVGPWALGSQTGTGLYNTAMGVWALSSNSSANNNAAFGAGALSNTTTGNNNTALGAWTLGSNITGINNTAVGAAALNQTTTGSNNSAFGIGALYNALSHNNSAFGFNALSETTTGGYNTAFGAAAGNKITSGFANLVLGPYVASTTLTTGSNNILIGYSDAVDTPAADTSSWLNIGNTIYADLLYKRMILTGQTATAGTTPTTGTIIDLGRASGADYSSVLLPKDTSANRPVAGVQGMIRYNTDTNALEAYVGATGTWSSLLSSTSSITGNTYLGASAAANNPSRSDDVTTGLFSGDAATVSVAVSGTERLRATSTGISITGDAYVSGSMSVNGLALLTGSGTQNYLVKWTTTDTLGTGMVYDTGTSVGIGTTTPTTGTILDMGAATGTAYSSLLLPQDTSANRPTGVAGMLRYNTTTAKVEAYQGTAWETLSGTSTAGSTIYLGPSAGASSPSRSDDVTTGLFSGTASTVSVSISGTERLRVSATGVNLEQTSDGYAIAGTSVLEYPNSDTTSIAVGPGALNSQTATNLYNIGVGDRTLNANQNGAYNTALGIVALRRSLSGSYNTAVGSIALESSLSNRLTGDHNTALGYSALKAGEGTAAYNTAVGSKALYATTTGNYNVALGYLTASKITTGSNNVVIGAEVASTTLATGSNNILIGTSSAVDTPAAGTSNWLNIGNTVYGDLANRRVLLTSVATASVSTPTDGTILDMGGATGTAYSSVLLPQDTSANRPTGVVGMIRYNTTTNAMEAYQGSSPAWVSLGSSTSTAGSTVYLGPSTASASPSREDDVTTGLFSGTASTVSVAIAGTEQLRVTSTGVSVTGYVDLTATSSGYYIAGYKTFSLGDGGKRNNIAIGMTALYSNDVESGGHSGNYNNAIGYHALAFNTATGGIGGGAGSKNNAIGYLALNINTATGIYAGSWNNAIGAIALASNTGSGTNSGSYNNAIGFGSLYSNTGNGAEAGSYNNAIGYKALHSNVSTTQYGASYNNAIGYQALYKNTGSGNTAIGSYAFGSTSNTISGSFNVALGYGVGSTTLTSGSNNILIGTSSLVDTATAGQSNFLNIGNLIYGEMSGKAVSIGSATITAGAGLDLSSRTGTAYSSVLLPQDTSANRPTTGVNGMIRYNTTLAKIEGYQGGAWETLSGTSTGVSAYLGASAAANNPSREDDVTTGLFSGTASTVSVATIGTEALRVTATQSVGIGTTTPAQLLDVNGNINVSAITNAYYLANNKILHQPASDTTSIAVGPSALAAQTATNLYNTAVGYRALYSTTGGLYNVALGNQALYSNTTGNGNIASGYQALFYNTTGNTNTAYGNAALLTNTTGNDNTGIGTAALVYNYSGSNNTAIGHDAMFSTAATATRLTGSYNVAVGDSALYSIQTTASANTAVGGQAMYSNTTGYFNTAMGYEPLRANTTGYMNIGIGYRALYNANSHNNLALGNTALYSNTSGYDNVGLGHGSMYHMATGRKNVSVGNYAFYYNTAGWFNTAVGNEAMLGQSGFTGHGNTALGNFSLYYLDSTAGYNTGLGYYAGMSITTGSSNVVIGPGVASAVLTTGASNILIGTSASVTTTAADTSNWLNIGNTVYGDLTNRRLLLTASATAAVTAPVAGTILDMGGATGTAYSSVLLPKDTSANRPTSPVVGMLRYNTTTAKVEAYQGSSWDTLSGTSTSSSSLGTSAGATSPARSDDATTGLFSGTSATVSTSISGTERLRVTANGIDLAASGYLNYYAIGGLGVLEFPYGDTSSIAVGYEALTAQNSGNRYNTAVGRSALATATGANYNTALGNNALNDLGNGTMNTAVGAGALQLTTTGNYNTAVGAFSSYYVTGTGNTGLGNYAMVYAGSGNNNTAVGNYAMASNSSYQLTGNYNTAVGDKALYSIRTTASGNTAIGGQALYSTTTAGWNSALGYQALYSNTTGVYNIAVGYQALYSTSTGLQNTVVGTAAAYSNTGGSNNQALGGWALYYNTTGHNNTAIGDYAINGAGVSLTGSYNAALGTHALYRAQGAASNNVGIGYQAGSQVTTGGNNTILGQSVASTTLATGSYNILIGYSSAVDTPAAATTYWLNIGNTIYGDLSNRRVLLTGATATSGTAATAGTILDMSAAGGTSYSSILLPKDTSANRPGSPVTGMLRYNTTTYTVEAYQGSSPAWTSLSGGSSTHYFGTSASSTVPSRSDDATTGLFSGTAATVSVSISGTERLRVSATGANLPQTANGYAIANTSVLEFPNSDTYSIAVGSGALNAQSVSTAYNTGLGYQALPANTTGLYNTAVGGLALTSNVSGGWNVAVGVNALYSTTASFNTGLGVDSLRYNTTGNYNTAIGMQTMYGNGVALTGTGNTAMGAQALYNVRGATSGNTAVGASAMYATTTGVQNTVVGYQAMVATTTGMQNTAVGYRAMAATTNGSWNAAFGQEALQANTTGFNNTALGVVALHQATTASNNTAVGVYALNQLTTGYSNIAMGTWAGGYISTGNENTAIGMYAMYGNTSYKVTGSMNTALGYAALYSIRTTAQLNVAVGASALYNTTTGSFNVAVGYQALYSTTTGVHSTAVGHGALYSNTVTGNTAVGFNTLYSNTTGSSNTAVGEYALRSNTTGYTNTAVGSAALYNNTTGVYNTGIGTGSLQQNLTGLQNTAVGTNSLTLNTGNYNAAFGATALYYNTSGEGNAGLGTGALFTNTTGSHNTAAGTNAMNNNATGSYNTAVGSQAMYSTSATATRLTGTYNTAVGYQSLYAIQTTASANTAVGAWAGYSNTTGVYNTSLGLQALYSNTTGMGNMAAGVSPLYSNTTGNMNVALGNVALASNTTGSYNVAVGYMALNRNSTPSGNVAIGNEALYSQTTPGAANMAIGYRAGYAITTGQGNTVMGYQALLSNVTGNNNTAIGYEALRTATSNGGNVGIGVYSLVSVTNGYNNVAVGNSTGLVLTTGYQNTILGNNVASTTLATGSNNILIGTSNAVTTPAADSTYFLNIGGVINANMSSQLVGINRGTTVASYPFQVGTSSSNGNGAYLTAAGVWTNASDRRLKENIRTSPYGLKALMKLKPSAYEMIGTHDKQIGFIAQDVAEVVPEVVSVDKEGRYGLSYGNLLTVAVKAIQEMKTSDDEDKEKIDALIEENRKLRQDLDKVMKTLSARNRAESRVASSVHTAKIDARLPAPNAQVLTPAEDGEPTQTVVILAAAGGGVIVILLGGLGACVFMLVRARRELKRVKKRRRRS